MEPIKILIADDHQLVIDGISKLIENEADLDVVGMANSGVEALEILDKQPIDIAVLDIDMEPMNGIDVARRIKEDSMNVKVLVLSMHSKKEYIETLLELDVEGYILKGKGIQELLEAIRTIAKGEKFYGRKLVDVIFNTRKEMLKKPVTKQIKLTKREREIVKLFAMSLNAPEIAKKLFLSTYTVETHRKNIYTKLGIKNNAQLVRYAIENGIS